jgi:hypothetical protein
MSTSLIIEVAAHWRVPGTHRQNVRHAQTFG